MFKARKYADRYPEKQQAVTGRGADLSRKILRYGGILRGKRGIVFFGVFFVFVFSFPFFAGALSLQPPSGLQSRALENTCSAEVTWNWVVGIADEKPSNTTTFEIQRNQSRGGAPAFSLPSKNFVSGPSPSGAATYLPGTYTYRFVDTGLTADETFSYRIITSGPGGEQNAYPAGERDFVGNVQIFSESAYPVPAAPQDVRVSWVGDTLEERRNNKTALVRWKGDVDMKREAGGFLIYRKLGAADFDIVGLTPIGRGTLADGSFAIDDEGYTYRDNSADLTSANSYVYKVVAFHEATGCTTAVPIRMSSASAIAAVGTLPFPPDLPTTLEFSSTQNSITVSWAGFTPYLFPVHFTISGVDGREYSIRDNESPTKTIAATAGRKYRVRFCVYRDDIPGENLSTCRVQEKETGVARPEFFTATPSNISDTGADVDFSWTDRSNIEDAFLVEWARSRSGPWNNQNTGAQARACARTSDGTPESVRCSYHYSGSRTVLYYRVRAVSRGLWSAPAEDGSDIAVVDLNVRPLKGWAWANAGGSQGNALGVGWISLSSANANAGTGGASYNVFLSGAETGDFRELSGYAWSGIRCKEERGQSASCGYGWLSFNKNDLAGCPSISGCEARVNVKTGEAHGWAKFLAADSRKGTWTGWVSLRGGGDYGVCLGDMNRPFDEGGTGDRCKGFMKGGGFMTSSVWDAEAFEATVGGENVFSGWAWADAVGGWIQFTGGATPSTRQECVVTGVRLINPPTGEIGLGKSITFRAEVLHEGNCDDVSNIDDVGWSIAPLSGAGTIGARTGIYNSPSTYAGARPLVATIRAQSAYDFTKAQEISVTILKDQAGCSLSLIMDPARLPSGPIALNSGYRFGVIITKTAACPLEAGYVNWTLVPTDAAYGAINADGEYAAPATHPGQDGKVKVIASNQHNSMYQASHTFTLGDSGGPRPGDHEGPDCQARSVSIEGLSRSVSVGQTTNLAALVSYNRAGCVNILDWSVVEGSAYGSVVSLAPGSLNSARYTAPVVAPSGESLPFQATVKACARNTELCDTKIVEIADVEPYINASCTNSKDIVRVAWGGMPTSPHSVEILRKLEGGSFAKIHDAASTLQSTGSCSDGNVLTGGCLAKQAVEINTTYYYKARVQYGGVTKETREDSARCEPAIISPTNVQVFTQDDKTLWVNWKDNDTRIGRKFYVERVRLTPGLLTYPGSMTDPNPGKRPAFVLGDSEIRLQWVNETNWTPYNHVIARLKDSAPVGFAEPNASIEVLEKIVDITIIGKGNNLLPFVPNPPHVESKKPFFYTDDSLQEATTYHYRVASCSQIPLKDDGGISKYVTKTIDGAVGKPEVACGLFSLVIATTTMVKTPTDLSVQALSSSRVRVTWKDNSEKESGYEIFRDGSATPVFVTQANAELWEDTGRSSDTEYSYQVRARAEVAGAGKIYSKFSESKSATTHFVVSVSTSGSGSGTVSPCAAGSSCEYAKGTTVTLSATPTGGSNFDGWSGGGCSGTGSCAVSGNANVTVRFSVAARTFTLIAEGGSAVVSVPSANGYTCTASPGSSCSTGLNLGRAITVTAAEGFTCESGCGSYTMPASDFSVVATVKLVGAFIPSRVFFANVLESVGSYVRAFGSFVRSVAEPLFGSDIRMYESNTNVRMRPETSRIYESSTNIRINPMDIIGRLIERGRRAVLSLFSLQISGAVVSPDYELFYKTVKGGFTEAAVPDTGLEPDTVYIYRVKSCVGTNCTAWSHESAGKTLRNVGTTVDGAANRRPICTRNSFCNYGTQFSKKVSHPVPGALVDIEESQQQCIQNAGCADVGRFEQSFEER